MVPPRPSRLFTALACLSALLCAALMVLWVRSVRTNDVLAEPHRPGDRWLVTSAFGTFTVERQAPQSGEPRPGWVYFEKSLPGNWPGGWRWFEFDAYRGRSRHYLLLPPARTAGVSVPHWLLIALFGILPFFWWRRVRRAALAARRRSLGRCPHCDYDLRATPRAGAGLLAVCPECGAATRPATPSFPPAGRGCP